MMMRRSERIVAMATKSLKKENQTILEYLDVPHYESTKGSNLEEQKAALEYFRDTFQLLKVVPPLSEKQQTRLDYFIDETDEEPFYDSGSEFVLSSTGESDSECESINNHYQKQTLNKKHTSKSPKCIEKYDETKENRPLNNISIKVAMNLDGKRVRDKGHSCYFCQKIIVNNLARHFEVNHTNEMEIARITAKPKKSKERKDEFLALTRCGDFYHNCNVLALKKGELILTRRPAKKEIAFSTYADYGPCPECLGFMLKKHIWHHLKYNCISKKSTTDDNETKLEKKKTAISESSALINGILGNNVSLEFTNNIMNKFKNDAISQCCKQDETILNFGAFMYEKYDTSQSELIRQSMRQLGRLTIELQNLNENVQYLRDCLDPQKFDLIVTATKELCIHTKENCKRPEFGVPSLALKIGYALRKCACIERGKLLRAGDLKGNKRLIAFSTLLDLEWNVRISSNALATLYNRKKSATDLLPITSDLVKLSNFLDQQIKLIKSKITDINSFKWTQLSSLTLSRIILFNKRRSGEAAKMTMSDYAARPNWDSIGIQEMKNSLTPFENKLASSLTIVRITGKRGRIVPVLLTKDMKEAIDQLVLTRVKCNISNENPYIFALASTSHSHMRGHDCLKKWCLEAELQSPDLITSTRLRKYVATVCQIFNLSENEYDWLARHLGHDVRVHRDFYRLQENTVELTKVSRLLLAVDQGEAHKYSGKELKDINIEDLPSIEDEEYETFDQPIESTNTVTEKLESRDEEILQDTKNSKEKQRKKIKDKNYSKRKAWTSEEKEIILKKFNTFIKHGSLPGKEKCEDIIKNYPIFASRKWSDLKFFVKNHLTKINKKTTIFK